VLAAALLIAAGCGGSKALSRQEFVKRADGSCRDFRKQFALDVGIAPSTLPALAAVDAKVVSLQGDTDKTLKGLKPPKDLQKPWKDYLEARKQARSLVAQERSAAARGDQNAVQALGPKQEASGRRRQQLARSMGLKVCGNPADLVELLGPPQPVAPPASLSYPKPVAPLSDAVARFQRAAASGSCDALRALQNSDDTKIPQQACPQLLAVLKGAKVLATEDLGPAGTVDVINAAGRQSSVTFVLDPKDRRLRLSAIVNIEGGASHPAPRGNRAEDNLSAAVEAIRRNDGAAFHKVVSEHSDLFSKRGKGVDLANPTGSGQRLTKAIRADAGAKPKLLGADQAAAFALLEANRTTWLLVAAHGPSGYKLVGYYPLPAR
jgi:hypothetical protein